MKEKKKPAKKKQTRTPKKKSPEVLEKIKQFKEEGLTEKEIAKKLDVGVSTLYYWAKLDKDYKKALKIGSQEVDLIQLEKLGAMMCTMEEVSAFLGIKKSTLSMRPDLMEVYNRGKEKGRTSLRRHQFKLAEKSASMAIFLGKQYLNQKDQQQLDLKTIDIAWNETKTYEDKND